MCRLQHEGTIAWIGLPDREATKLQELWDRGEVGMELSVEVRAPVVIGVYPMRIARYVLEGTQPMNGHVGPDPNGHTGNGVHGPVHQHPRAPRPMTGAPGYGRPQRHA